MIPLLAQPGDFFVVRTHGLAAQVIRAATRSAYNHAGIYLPDGMCVEAAPEGARYASADYGNDAILVSHILLSDLQRKMVCEAAKSFIGTPYGWVNIASVGALQYGLHPYFLRNYVEHTKELICSQLVDEAYWRAGIHLFQNENPERTPMDVTPGDLARLIRR